METWNHAWVDGACPQPKLPTNSHMAEDITAKWEINFMIDHSKWDIVALRRVMDEDWVNKIKGIPILKDRDSDRLY